VKKPEKMKHQCKNMSPWEKSGVEITGYKYPKATHWRLSTDEYSEDLDLLWCRSFAIDYCPICGIKLIRG